MTSKSEHRLAHARQAAADARQRLTGTMVELQARLSPRNLVAEAVEEARDRAEKLAGDLAQSVRDRPATATAAVVTLILFLGRDWIFNKLTEIIARWSDSIDSDDHDPEEDQP